MRNAWIAPLALLCTLSAAQAEVLNFVFDPAQSYLKLEIQSEDGVPFSSAQFPGSDVTALSGSANIDVTPGHSAILTNGRHPLRLAAPTPGTPLQWILGDRSSPIRTEPQPQRRW